MCILTLRLDKELMLVFVGESDNLCLYARAISRTDALDLTVVKRRIRKSFAKYLMSRRIRIYDMAWALLKFPVYVGKIGKMMQIVVITLLTGG